MNINTFALVDNSNTQDLFDRSIDKIIDYGISFEGKTICVKSKEIGLS